ncbi:MAG: glycosyl hydrolase family 79 C-terminal domain-containing protein [Solirubrobacteraceae bacterium]
MIRATRYGAALLSALALLAVASPRAQAFVFRLSVTRAQRPRAISSNFVGVALEYSALRSEVGYDSKSANPVLVQLIRNLAPNGRPLLRIGGLSTDRTWWPQKGLAAPAGVTFGLSTAWTTAAKELAQAANAQLLLGLNLQADRPKVDSVEANQLIKNIGRQYIGGFEIGNEPELYTDIAWYRSLGGKRLPWYSKQGSPVYARPSNYSPQTFIGDFERVLHVLPNVSIAGPSAGIGKWLSAFGRLESRHSRVRLVTAHDYSLNSCDHNPASPSYPTVPHLLSAATARGFAGGVGSFAGRAHGAGASFRIDEMNSVTCNGRAGVSNTMASALWMANSLFTLAADGVDGVNIHTFPKAANGLFDFSTSHGQWRATVHPVYYGALLFSQAAPAGAHLLRIHSSNQKTVHAWATTAPDHHVRVLLINDNLHSSGTAVVNAAGTTGPATVERLRASSAYATGGVTLGGKSFGTTSTGVLGAPNVQTVTARSGRYSVSLPPASAALLTLSS